MAEENPAGVTRRGAVRSSGIDLVIEDFCPKPKEGRKIMLYYAYHSLYGAATLTVKKRW
jgi:hypothetical protein